MRSHRAVFAFIAGSTLLACAGGGGYLQADPNDPSAPGNVAQPLEALVPLQGCGEVEQYLRGRLADAVNRRIDAAIKSVNERETCSRYVGYDGDDDDDAMGSVGSSSGSSGTNTNGSGSSSGDSAKESSSTNNQTAGVDEADFIKNDDKYLYLASNGAFRVVEAWPAESMAEVAKIAIDGTPKKLFVEGDRALVYVSVPREIGDANGDSYANGVGYSSGSECTYGYDCVPSGDGTATKLVVFDIADRRAPKKVREIALSGSLLSARRIGNAVHTVVVDTPPRVEGLRSYPEDTSDWCEADDTASWRSRAIRSWEALRAENLAVIAKVDVMKQLPAVTENGASALAACGGYFRPNVAEGTTLTSLVSVDIDGGASTVATVVSDPGVVYASETGLYMSVPHRRSEGLSWYTGMESEKQASVVHKFRVGATPALTGYEASGVVKGRVLNQFALDEHDGALRVATTTGRAPSKDTHSTMSVLERRGPGLVLTGKVDQIAPTEDIRSVRFDGSRGFIVTFKKTDPLYVFDLGDKTAPRITGELKIPGFSTYMHMMDASHLLTIGYDADDQGSFAYFQGVMLQVFDVSDMKNPRLAHKEIIGTRGSSSEALTNHLAFTYYAPKNLLALPMTVCEDSQGGGGSYGMTMSFSGLMLYDVTTAGGFQKRGQVAHPSVSTGDGYNSSGCYNWWTNASSEVKRSVIMDDVVFSISDLRVKANRLSNPSADVAVVSLQ
ncbi:MAG: beta-propeller domain-containing protein [Labilithrix sp.]|nr:beta-propeller domain-containing protein [Labilithrix sp.]MCW5814984.1 beta-propeller domain-containing protein [Labilithrix sp.]